MSIVAERIVDILIANRIKTVFAVPGVNVMPLLECINNRPDMRLVICKTELGAEFMADGYARENGIGCCIGTTGPGVANTIPGVCGSYNDSVPVIIISAQVAGKEMGKYGIQEMTGLGRTPNMLKMMEQITKASKRVQSVDEVENSLIEILKDMNIGRKGPGYYEICEELLSMPIEKRVTEDSICVENDESELEIDFGVFFEVLTRSKNPVVVIGNGVSKSTESRCLLQELFKLTNVKYVTTALAKDILPMDHTMNFGVIGCYGNKHANLILEEADTILVLGACMSYLSTSGWSIGNNYSYFARVDIDENEIKRNYNPDQYWVCDCKRWLHSFYLYCREHCHSGIMGRKEILPSIMEEDVLDTSCIHPVNVVQIINSVIKGEDAVVVDVGQNAYWAERYINIPQDGRFFIHGGMGAMGYGVAACIGINCALDEKNKRGKTICICGDGGYLMNGNELNTAAKYGFGVIWVVFNNGTLGTQKVWAEKTKYNITFDIDNVNISKNASSFGVESCTVTTIEHFYQRFVSAYMGEKPTLIEVQISASTYPISYYGKSVRHINR